MNAQIKGNEWWGWERMPCGQYGNGLRRWNKRNAARRLNILNANGKLVERKKDAEVLCRLLVTLIYLRQNWTMQAIAESIECAESTGCNYIHEILPSIETQLPASLLE